MRFITGLGMTALALFLGGTAKPAAAQQAPPGSYQQTCRNIGVRGNTLYADCQDTNRNWQAAQLRDFDRCNGEIQNLNGSLQCTGNGNGRGVYGGYGQGGYNGPYDGPYNNGSNNGSYRRDRDHDHDGDRDRDRDRANSGYGYGNNGYGNGLPYGSYSQTCQNVRVNGNELQARCEKKNGGWRDTSLRNYSQCREIENDNGKLRCR
jgi:CVNH domain